MSKHAKFGPSSMARILACPGSVRLSEQSPPQKESPYAAEGTLAHAVGEALLLGEQVPDHPEEMMEAVKVYVDYCDPLLSAASKYGIEARLTYNDALFGTADCYCLIDRILYVIDYKHGAGVTVTAAENKQGMTYAGLVFEDEKTGIDYEDVDTIVITIVQPRGQGAPIDEWRTTPVAIEAHMEEVFEAMLQAEWDAAPIAMGDHCRWCRAKLVNCPAVEAAQRGVAEWDRRDVSPEQIAQLLADAAVVEARIRELRDYAHERISVGETVPGWHLKPKRAQRRWSDKKAVEAWAKEHGVDLFKSELISPAQAAKIAPDHYSESLSEFVVSESSGVTLAPGDDPNPSPFAGLQALAKRV